MRLHREGTLLIPLSILIVGGLATGLFFLLKEPPLIYIWYVLAAAGAILIGLVFNFFRNPVIPPTVDAGKVFAPCDGKVVVIEEIEDDHYLKSKRIQVSIFMSPLNVHVNRNPVGGRVSYLKYLPGKYLMAFNPKSSTDNEQTYIVIDNGKHEIAFKQIAGFLARRIKWYIKENDQVNQGEEMGFIRFGSRVDILLPIGSKVEVELGQKTYGARTVVASLPEA